VPSRRGNLRGCALALICVITIAACASGTGRRPAPAPVPAPVLSNYERSTGNAIARDCGYSSPVPGRPNRSVWLFCDTEVTGSHDRTLRGLILGTDSAAAGPYQSGQAPAALSEIPTPPAPLTSASDAPQPFLPAPSNLSLPGTTLPCSGTGAYPAAWISGVTRAPQTADALLVTFDEYCVAGGLNTAEGFGLAEYDPANNILSPTVLVFTSFAGLALPQQQVLGSPVTGPDGYLYLFGFCPAAVPPTGCGGRVFVARTVATPAGWQNPSTYQYWTGAGWSAQAAMAASVIPAGQPVGVSVADYTAVGQGLVMIEQTSLAGDFQAWQAASPAGPWRRFLSGRVPCTDSGGLCRALIGHPELSTRDRLLISYFDPGNNHVDVSAYPWRE
jgi:hypothetical protein